MRKTKKKSSNKANRTLGQPAWTSKEYHLSFGSKNGQTSTLENSKRNVEWTIIKLTSFTTTLFVLTNRACKTFKYSFLPISAIEFR